MCYIHTYACVLRACKLLLRHTRLLYSNEIISIISLTPDGVSGQYHSVAFVTPGTLYQVAVSVETALKRTNANACTGNLNDHQCRPVLL